jgi:hypothetical protein
VTAAVAIANAAALAGVALTDHGFELLALVSIAPAVAAILRRPQLAILAIVALVPYDGLLEIVPHPLVVQGWKEALMLLALAATFVAPAARAAPGRRLPPWTPAVIGLAVTALCSAALVGGLSGAYGLKVGFFWALAFVVIWRCPLNARERDRAVTILMVNGVITSIIGVAQQFIGGERLHELGYEYNTVIRTAGSFLRSFSTFSDPFSFGYFVMIVLLIGLPVALGDTRRPRNQLFLAALPILGAGILSSTVRGAWLGFAAGLIYIGGSRFRVLLMAVPLGLAALLVLPSEVADTALSATSSQERANTWAENFTAILHKPFGNGIGTTGAAAGKVDLLQGRDEDYFEPDNYYFAVTYELGPLGLWWHVLRMAYTLIAVRAAARLLEGEDSHLAVGMAAFVVATACASLIANFFGIFPTDTYWWILLGLVSTSAAEASRSQAAEATSAAV